MSTIQAIMAKPNYATALQYQQLLAQQSSQPDATSSKASQQAQPAAQGNPSTGTPHEGTGTVSASQVAEESNTVSSLIASLPPNLQNEYASALQGILTSGKPADQYAALQALEELTEQALQETEAAKAAGQTVDPTQLPNPTDLEGANPVPSSSSPTHYASNSSTGAPPSSSYIQAMSYAYAAAATSVSSTGVSHGGKS